MKIVELQDGEFLHHLEGMELEFIAETNKEISIFDVLIIGNTYYNITSVNHAKKIIGARKFNPSNEDEKLYENHLTCPYCGYKDVDAFELSDDEGETQCGRCNSKLEYEREYEVTYNTKLIKKPNRIKIR